MIGRPAWMNEYLFGSLWKTSPLPNPVHLFPKSTGPTPVAVIWKSTVLDVVVGTCPHQWSCWDILLRPCNHTAWDYHWSNHICAPCHGHSAPPGLQLWSKWQDFVRKLTTWFGNLKLKWQVSEPVMHDVIDEWLALFLFDDFMSHSVHFINLKSHFLGT